MTSAPAHVGPSAPAEAAGDAPGAATASRSRLAETLIDRGLNVRVVASLLDRRPVAAATTAAVGRLLAETPSPPDGMSDLVARVADHVLCRDGLPGRRDGRPLWTAFLGGTGVGKTTTIAKLAAWYGLSRRLKIGLVTVDTYRVGAVDQLAAYADVLQLPLEVVTSVEGLAGVRRRFADCDWVLVDTAGRSPRDEEPIAQVTRLLSAMPLDETLWVHPVSQGVEAYRHLRSQWSRVRPTGLVLTKLDECPRWGHLWDVLKAGDPPLTYLTDGQNVPQDILTATNASVAAALLLGAGAVTQGRPRGRSHVAEETR